MRKIGEDTFSHKGIWLIRPVLIIVLIGLAACASEKPYRVELMNAPEVYEEDGLHPFSDTAKIGKDNTIGVLYATDREQATPEQKEDFYQNDRGKYIRIGRATIKLGEGDVSWDEMKRISLLKNRTEEFPLQVTAIEEFGILDASISPYEPPEIMAQKSGAPAKRFAELVNARLSRSRSKDVFVYVPGFKVIFENPLLVASELWHYMGYQGVFVAYSWPATPSLWAYVSDAETAAVSTRRLRLFIQFLAERTAAEKIHIIGYSAGTRVVTGALGDLALIYSNEDADTAKARLRIGNVILIGSDMDRDIFNNALLDGVLDITDNLNIYVSKADQALVFSKQLFSRERLGMIQKDPTVSKHVAKLLMQLTDLNFIDVTDAEGSTSGNGHAYFRKSPWASSDILVTLMYGLAPADRGLERTPELPVWTFPPDYIARLKSVLSEVNPDLKPLTAPQP